MSNIKSIKSRFAPELEIAFNSIQSAYMGLGNRIEHPPRSIIFQNYTDAAIKFSQDGVTDHLTLPTGGHLVLDLTTNKGETASILSVSVGDRFYVRYMDGAPTRGSAYIAYTYAY